MEEKNIVTELRPAGGCSPLHLCGTVIMQSKQCCSSLHCLEQNCPQHKEQPWLSRLLGKSHVLYLCAAVFPGKSATSKVTAMSVFLLKASPHHS